ncbi:MAG TPA: hypothetical protein VJS45_12880 [Acidimicrobiia bacterium]|nr:hypothetical protein [Acidimicrobiia bacterium]
MAQVDLDTIWLARGSHPGSGKGCLMEWVAVFAGLPKTDRPVCTNRLITSVAVHLNDTLDDATRQRLRTLIPQVVQAGRTAHDSRIDRRLAVWCAGSVPPPQEGAHRSLHRAALEAATGYLDGLVSEERCRAAAAAAAEAGAQVRSVPLYLAADAAHAAVADDPEPAVVNAVAGAVAWTVAQGEPVAWFRRLLAAHAEVRAAESGAGVATAMEVACCPA